ncbi:hypothetical protein, partial [Phenylobacterium sp.]|uniref:hypothetical protein n=1 Tax=Phenylobacterium sp. TaxID=1871053 RepID=UPI002600D7F8
MFSLEHRPDIAADLDGLSRLSERLLGLAMRYADRIEALAEDEDERAVALARPLEGLARSYRQTLAMKARLRREVGDLERAERTREILANRPAPDFGVLSRMAEVEEAVSALIWSEHERPEAERLEDELVDALHEAFDDPA